MPAARHKIRVMLTSFNASLKLRLCVVRRAAIDVSLATTHVNLYSPSSIPWSQRIDKRLSSKLRATPGTQGGECMMGP